MGRIIAGAALGCVVMLVIVSVVFSVAYNILGTERVFRAGSFEITRLWMAVTTVLGLAAAVLAGWTAVIIGRGVRAGGLLAIVVVVLGIVLALPTLNAPRTHDVRTGNLIIIEAMLRSQWPAVVTVLSPVIMGIGVMLGARLRRPI